MHTSTNPHTLRRRARWLLETGAYDFEHLYRPGAQNIADPLSRAPQYFRSADLHTDQPSTPVEKGMALLLVAIDTPPEIESFVEPERSFMAFTRAPYSGAKQGFSLIGGFPADALLRRILSGIAASDVEVLAEQHKLTVDEHGFLWTKQSQVFVPDVDTLRADIIQRTHGTILGGHYGVTRTVLKL